jgi:serpin B
MSSAAGWLGFDLFADPMPWRSTIQSWVDYCYQHDWHLKDDCPNRGMTCHVPPTDSPTTACSAATVYGCRELPRHARRSAGCTGGAMDAAVRSKYHRAMHPSTGFACALWQSMPKGNFAVSPASISAALAMAMLGAGGETAAQMRAVLDLDAGDTGAWAALLESRRTPRVELAVASRLFGEASYVLAAAFLAHLQALGAPLVPVDFVADHERAREQINAWVAEHTGARITDLLPSGALDRLTRLVIVNAIYFLADWATPFTGATHPLPFAIAGGKALQVPTMHQIARLRWAQGDGVTVVELPYVGGELAMLIVLPDAVDGLAAVEHALTPGVLEDWLDALAPARVALALPRFKIDPAAPLELSRALAELGMLDAFDQERAEFSVMDPSDQLYITVCSTRRSWRSTRTAPRPRRRPRSGSSSAACRRSMSRSTSIIRFCSRSSSARPASCCSLAAWSIRRTGERAWLCAQGWS